MATKQLAYKQLPVVSALPTPVAGLEGVVVELSSDKKPYYCTGTEWISLGVRIIASTTAPSSPSVGDIWVDTN